MAPYRGQVSRGEWWAMSGKAIDAAPPARTAIWEVTLFVEESEGHTANLRPLCYRWRKHLPHQSRTRG